MIFQKRNTTGANGGAGTAYTSGAPVFTHFLVEFVLLNISFSVLYFVYHVCRFVSFLLTIALSVLLWIMPSTDYPIVSSNYFFCYSLSK